MLSEGKKEGEKKDCGTDRVPGGAWIDMENWTDAQRGVNHLMGKEIKAQSMQKQKAKLLH